jgi:hypothetical protein
VSWVTREKDFSGLVGVGAEGPVKLMKFLRYFLGLRRSEVQGCTFITIGVSTSIQTAAFKSALRPLLRHRSSLCMEKKFQCAHIATQNTLPLH